MAQITVETYTNGALVQTRQVTVPDAAVNGPALLAKAAAALDANSAFLALPAPTNAQILAQLRLLTREVNALIRLATGLVDTIPDT